MGVVLRLRSWTLFFCLAASLGSAAPAAVGPRREGLEPGAVAGSQVVVKYRDSVGYSVQCLLERGIGLAQASGAGGVALEALHRRHDVRTARALFRNVDQERSLASEDSCPPVAAHGSSSPSGRRSPATR